MQTLNEVLPKLVIILILICLVLLSMRISELSDRLNETTRLMFKLNYETMQCVVDDAKLDSYEHLRR